MPGAAGFQHNAGVTVSSLARRGAERRTSGRPPAPPSPPATRQRGSSWRDPRLVVGVVLVAASGLLGASLLGGGSSTTAVWAAERALAAGETVAGQDLTVREVRFTDQADADRYLAAGQALPDGAVLARPVGAGELVPRAALSGADTEQVLEVPLPVPVESLPATVRPGSTVDVWVTPDPTLTDAREIASVLVLDDVRVLQLGRSGGSLGPGGTRQVVVGVGPAQEPDLPDALARVAGGSVVMVRTP